ncbi:MAG: hypothetical protein WAL45_10740 [Terracidiphilus sp.]
MTSRKLRGAREKFWQDRYYDSNVYGEQARSEVIRYIHRNPGSPAREFCVLGWNPVKRGLVAKPEDCHPTDEDLSVGTQVAVVQLPAICDRATGTVEIESQRTAWRRGNQLPEGVRVREGERLCLPTQAAKDAAWMGHNPSRESQE